jgi:hypothetical protein
VAKEYNYVKEATCDAPLNINMITEQKKITTISAHTESTD